MGVGLHSKDLYITDIRWELHQPRVKQRKINKEIAKDKKERKDIEEKPWQVTKDTILSVKFVYKGVEYTRKEEIEKGWTYNYANIPWFAEPITYDKHSPYMKIPSLAHDRVLDFRYRLWYEWGLDEIFENDLGEFRKLTSLIFEYLCVDSGVPVGKAKLMATSVDTFQKCMFKDWGRKKFKQYKKEQEEKND